MYTESQVYTVFRLRSPVSIKLRINITKLNQSNNDVRKMSRHLKNITSTRQHFSWLFSTNAKVLGDVGNRIRDIGCNLIEYFISHRSTKKCGAKTPSDVYLCTWVVTPVAHENRTGSYHSWRRAYSHISFFFIDLTILMVHFSFQEILWQLFLRKERYHVRCNFFSIRLQWSIFEQAKNLIVVTFHETENNYK